MSSPKPDNPIDPSGDESIFDDERVRRLLINAAVLLVVFLVGFVPMWLTARGCARERDTVQAALRISTLQNGLASAAIQEAYFERVHD